MVNFIQTFSETLVSRAKIETPCQWIQDLELEHAPTLDKVKITLKEADTIYNDRFKELFTKTSLTASLGLGLGLGGFLVVVLGGGGIGIALAIIGFIGGAIAGVFMGIQVSKESAELKSRPKYKEALQMEVDWIQLKLPLIDTQIEADPTQGQLPLLKDYFEQVLKKKTELFQESKASRFLKRWEASVTPDPAKGTPEALFLEAATKLKPGNPTPAP